MAFGPVTKYPEETLDLPAIIWTAALGTHTIIASVWTVSSTDIDIEATTFTATAAIVRVSGGTAGKTYYLQNTVTWDDGQTRVAEIRLDVNVDDV